MSENDIGDNDQEIIEIADHTCEKEFETVKYTMERKTRNPIAQIGLCNRCKKKIKLK